MHVRGLDERDITTVVVGLPGARRLSCYHLAKVAYSAIVPPLGYAVGSAGVLVAGETEADEPLAIELSGRLLQQRQPPPVVIDEVVVGGEGVGDALLYNDQRRTDGVRFDLACIQIVLSRPLRHVVEDVIVEQQSVVDEPIIRLASVYNQIAASLV